MLNFILGKVSSGKTTYLHNKLGQALDEGADGAVLIVPEQFTFETDRGILHTLGPMRSNKVGVYSFTRLAEILFEEYGYEKKPVITEQSRLIFMSRALREVGDRLEVYKKHIDDKAFIGKMILVVNEFRQSANEKEHMHAVVDSLEDGLLKSKMNELMLICDAYEAVTAQSYIDTTDVLDDLYTLITETNCFFGKTVALDGFSSFNAQILKIIGAIMSQCRELYITLTTDSVYYTEGQSGVFAFTSRTASRLRALAEKNSVPVAKPVIISEETTGFSPYASKYLSLLEKSFYRYDAGVCADKTDDISIYCAADIYDECCYVARKIRQLTREGIRCRDIAVIYRDEEKYESKLKAAFAKYGVPVFEDKREPIANQPIILFVHAALKICAEGFSTESIMRLLKTGLSEFSAHEISELENYVYMWSIDGAKWKSEWTYNPKGFTDSKPDEAVLSRINEMREKTVTPLMSLRESIKNADGEAISRAIYDFLISAHADEGLKRLAVSLEEDGEYSLALEQEQVWDILMETLNECALSLKGEALTASRYLDMFELSLSVRTLGRVPNGIDEVTVGAASRIKTRNTDVVFVLGLNSGVFPKDVSGGGLLSNKDKTVLLQSGLELFDIDKYKSLEERFIAYNAVCRARKKLFLSYALRSGGAGDGKLTPSEIVGFVRKQFPLCEERTRDDVTLVERIEGRQAAFELLAEKMREGGFYPTNLMAYFSTLPEYEQRLESLKRAAGELDFEFSDKENAKALFGMDMYLSASRVEEYEKCPFKYFCRYGMGAQPRLKAALDPMQSGTLVHYVLENIIREYRDIGIENVPKDEREKKIRELLVRYADKCLGGLDGKDGRFSYHFSRFAKILDTLTERICAEFSNSSFVPCEFELEIGDGGKVPAYSLELSDGGTVKIHGYIDRVDKYELDGKSYLRVVDYKTGKKDMVLSDVMNGMNMQMLIYLFALWKNGGEMFGDGIVPAGVLYFPANRMPFSAERGQSEAQINEAVLGGGKMSGLILDDSRIIRAMDESGGCVFIPLKKNSRSGKLSGNLISLKQLELLNKKTDSLLKDMALSLHSGHIPAFPVSGRGHENTCDYCDYRSVCGHEAGGKYRHIEPERFEESLERLEEGGDD